MAFAGAFPESVRSLVLFGPAGLLHRLPEGYDNPVLLHPELAPSAEAICEAVRQILGVKPSEPPLTVTLDQKGSIPCGVFLYRCRRGNKMHEGRPGQIPHPVPARTKTPSEPA